MTETRECEICHRHISTNRAVAWTNHMRKHEQAGETQTAATPAPPIAPSGTETPNTTEPAKWTDETERSLYERAKLVEAKLLAAPETLVVSSTRDEFMELRRAFAPDTIDEFENLGGGRVKCTKRATRHEYYAKDDNEVQAIIHAGYVPTRNPETAMFVRTSTGEVLTTIDRRIFDAREASAQAESRARLPKKARKGMPGVRIREKDDDAAASADVNVLEVERKKGGLEDL